MNEKKPTQPVNSPSIESAVSQTTLREGAPDDFLSNLFDRLTETRNDESRVPRKIGTRTRIVGKRRIGIGGLGAVYEYWDRSLDRPVALKVIKRRSMESESRRKRFLRERELTAQLQHPAIPSVFQSGELRDGRPYYLMQRIQGKTLHEYLRRDSMPAGDFRENQDLRSLLDAFLDVCDAVHHAHSLGIVHRDIKPANIMIDDDGAAYLVDWGLARNIKNSLESKNSGASVKPFSELTQDGHLLGSPDWMSPEQAKGDHKEHGIPTDIYGLGATLYHILSGYPPHTLADRDVSFERQMSAIATNDFLPAEVRNPNVPAELSSICSRAMSQNPADRYQTAAALKQDLRAWIERLPVEAHRGQYSIADRITMFSAKHRKSVFAGISMLLVIVVSSIVSIVMVNQSARAAEEALSSEREANQRLFASLEAFADTIMSDDVLASPELKDLRERLLTELTSQYELWSERESPSPREQLRASRGSARLAEIDLGTGNLSRVLSHTNRAVQIAQRAISTLENPSDDEIVQWLDVLRLQANMQIQAGQINEAEHSVDVFASEVERYSEQLPSVNFLRQLAHVSKSRSSLYYRKSVHTLSESKRTDLLRQALQQAQLESERRHTIAETLQGKEENFEVVSALSSVALFQHKLYQAQDAADTYESALRVLDDVASKTSTEARQKKILMARIFGSLLMTYRRLHEFDKAVETGLKSVRIFDEFCKQYPLIVSYKSARAQIHSNLAEVGIVEFLHTGNTDALQTLIIHERHSAEQFIELFRQYPERQSLRASAAKQHLRLAKGLHWAGRDEEAIREFERCLQLIPHPERIEPGHQANAYAVAIGYALLLKRDPSSETHRSRLTEVLAICSPLLKDSSKQYQDVFLADDLFSQFDGLPLVKDLYDEVHSSNPK